MVGSDEGVFVLFKQKDFWFAFSSEILIEIIRSPLNIEEENNRIDLRNENLALCFFDDIMTNTPREIPLAQSCILILDGKKGRVGLVIDQAEEVINLEKSAIFPVIPLILKGDQHMFLGVTSAKDRLVTILDHTELYEKCIQNRSGNN